MNPDIFREFSIRGIADQELTDDIVIVIGQALGTFLKRYQKASLLVGRDVRNSSARISQALIAGLVQTDIKVTDIGQVPTPVLNFTVDSQQADGGIMITASHNPPEDNGLKIRTDHILSGDELREIYQISQIGDFLHSASATGISTENINYFDPLPSYLAQLKTIAQPLSLKVVVDGGNGTNGLIVSQLLRDLGCKVFELYCEPDGDFPNRSPDPTKSNAVVDLSARVRLESADVGVAYDGDGDRLVVVDELGNIVPGDQLIMILARDVLRHGPAKIVCEILCTQALIDDVRAHGGEPIVTPSGYAFVHQVMHNSKAALGGEFSGHLFFNEPGFFFDDAILGTVKFLNILVRARQSVSALVAALPAYSSSPQIRIPCPDIVKSTVIENVKSYFEQDYEVNTLDGVQVNFGYGRALVRQSNTQPVISMRFEAHTSDQLMTIQTRVLSVVETEINQLTNTH